MICEPRKTFVAENGDARAVLFVRTTEVTYIVPETGDVRWTSRNEFEEWVAASAAKETE